MAKDVSDIPDSLKDALKRGRVIPFVGAGVSMAIKKLPLESVINKDGTPRKDKAGNDVYKSAFPSWYEFLINAADKLVKENKSAKANVVRSLLDDTPPDYLESAQRAFDGLGATEWYKLLSENFEIDITETDKDSQKLAELMWELGSNLIVTTNVDLVLQSTHPKPQPVKILDTQSAELAELQKDWKPLRPNVLHLHGHIDNKPNVVFTRQQYNNFYNFDKNRAKLETLRSLLTQRTILFIGFSLDDLFILRELERVKLIYDGAGNSYYALLHEDQINNPNIPSYVNKIPFADFGKPLEDLVEELARIAEEDDDKGEEKSIDVKTQSPDETKKDAQEAFFNVPYRSKGDEFVGRKGKKEEIWNALNKGGCASIGQAVSVKGFGGLGKTQLAVEFADAYKDRYKNGVYWLVADTNIENQIVQIADERKWINKDDKSINQIEVAKARFKQISDCLILVDNVEAFDDVKDYLPKTDSHTHLLITSREKDGRFHEIDIDLLNRDESRELLLRVSNRNPKDENEKAELEKILEILGGIPLAVELVGGYLAEHENVTFAKYHQYLNEVPLDALEKEFSDGSFTDHECSIIQTLRISEKTIEKKPLMFEIFKVLAWSGSSSMGVSLLQAMINAESEFAFDTALGDALKLRLISEEEESERYTIHRLLAKIIRHEHPLASDLEWHTKKAENLEKWFEDKEDDFKYLAEFESEIEHLESWQEQTMELLPASAIILTNLRRNIPYQRGNYQTALAWSLKAYKLVESEKLDDKELKTTLQNDLGLTYGELGEYHKALEYQEKALALRKELFGEQHPATANSYNNVGSTYGALGEHRKALEYQEKALELEKEIFGEHHPFAANSYNSIGHTYRELGENRKALEYQEKALALQKELFGEQHPDTATFYSNVGGTYGALGEHHKALEYQEKALDLRKEIFGEKHPDTANSYNNVGGTYGDLGKHRKALEYKEKALELQKELFGEKHPNTATFYSNVGGTYLDLGDYHKALEYSENALNIHQKLLGKQHPNSIFIARNLIITYLNLGNN